MRRMEGSMIVRHHREPKLLMSEVPRNRMGRLQTGSVKTTFKEPPEMLFAHEGGQNQPPGHPPMAQPIRKVVSEAKRIDVISRIIFPGSFLGFNIMYWSYYLTRSRYQDSIIRQSLIEKYHTTQKKRESSYYTYCRGRISPISELKKLCQNKT